MSWSINEVAKMTGLTSRALRHYDAIGLLLPGWTADGGRRYYDEPELIRLQEILLLRSLGLSLDTIAVTLENRGAEQQITVLREHLRQLKDERERTDKLINTVNRTIESIKENKTMNPEELFGGLIDDPYEALAREAYGDKAIDHANDRVRLLNSKNRELFTSGRGFHEIHQQLADLKKQNLPIDAPQVQKMVARHYEIVTLVWTPTAKAYIALGQGYASNEDFRKNIGKGDDSLVTYLADAMKEYATKKL